MSFSPHCIQRPKKEVEPKERPRLKHQKSFYEEEEAWGHGFETDGGEEFVDYGGKIPAVQKDIFFGREDDYLEEVDSAPYVR